jgi:NADH-quinone oxidoreductase subunit L
VTAAAALLTVLLPLAGAAFGLPTGRRSRAWAQEWAVLGTLGAFAAACLEQYGVQHDGPVPAIGLFGLFGRVDTGGVVLSLDIQADSLSAVVAVAVGLVAVCVQLYSIAYLPGEGTPDAPTRYPAYAATVSMFTAAMMLVVHSADLVLLLVGWEVMGLASYLLVGHHSERQAARNAAVKAFLVTRLGDVGVLLAVVALLFWAGTTSIPAVLGQAATGELSRTATTTVCLLLLAGIAGKSAQFPLHTWLPDAMEGPTPVSALIHAATMVAAGAFLLARMLPLYLSAPAALATAAVIASISMLGAALAALAADDLKRLLAWSTISQVAYMIGAIAVANTPNGYAPGIAHLLSHAAFKALLFLTAGCLITLAGTPLMSGMAGVLRHRGWLALAFALGLGSLAGVPPLGGFWSKEAVLSAAEAAAGRGEWTGWLVYLTGLTTTLVTGIYAGRAWSLVSQRLPEPQAEGLAAPALAEALPDALPHGPAGRPMASPAQVEQDEVHPGQPTPGRLPVPMTFPLLVLAVPTALFGLVLITPPPALSGIHLNVATSVTGSLLALAGLGWAISAQRLGAADVADAFPARTRAVLREGFRFDDLQDALVVRPVRRLARTVGQGDRDVVDAYVRGVGLASRWGGLLLRRASTGLATGYVAWVVVGAVAVGVAGVILQ